VTRADESAGVPEGHRHYVAEPRGLQDGQGHQRADGAPIATREDAAPSPTARPNAGADARSRSGRSCAKNDLDAFRA